MIYIVPSQALPEKFFLIDDLLILWTRKGESVQLAVFPKQNPAQFQVGRIVHPYLSVPGEKCLGKISVSGAGALELTEGAAGQPLRGKAKSYHVPGTAHPNHREPPQSTAEPSSHTHGTFWKEYSRKGTKLWKERGGENRKRAWLRSMSDEGKSLTQQTNKINLNFSRSSLC